MRRNQVKVQRQKDYGLIELFIDYGAQEQCRSTSYSPLKSRKIYQCNHQNSLSNGAVFASPQFLLTPWF